MPMPMYATFESDAVMKDGNIVGVSQWPSYTANANHFISLGLVDVEDAAPGTDGHSPLGRAGLTAPDPSRVTPCGRSAPRSRPSPYFAKVIKTGMQ